MSAVFMMMAEADDTGHRTTQEQADDVHTWLADELTGRNVSSADRRR